jgi:hypothetical protein
MVDSDGSVPIACDTFHNVTVLVGDCQSDEHDGYDRVMLSQNAEENDRISSGKNIEYPAYEGKDRIVIKP